MIYLDNAATTYPKPACVVETLRRSAQIYGANPGRGGYEMCISTSKQVYAVREKIAAFFNAEGPEYVVFTSNCTQALNTAIHGSVKRCSHVLTSCLEHNSVMRPLEKMRKEGKIVYDCAEVGATDDETVENFRVLLSKRTSLIVCTCASNVFGDVLPIRKIGLLAKERNIPFVVDAAQGAGIVPIDMKRENISCLCLPGHKGLYGPMGTGAMILSKDFLPETLMQGGTGTLSKILDQPDGIPERYESGTINVPGIVALGKGVDFVSEVGIKNMRYHENSLVKYLFCSLHNTENIRLYHDYDEKRRVPVLSFNIGNIPCEQAAEMLGEDGIAVRGGFHCNAYAHRFYQTYEEGTLRASVSFFNCKKDIDYLLNSIKKIAKRNVL